MSPSELRFWTITGIAISALGVYFAYVETQKVPPSPKTEATNSSFPSAPQPNAATPGETNLPPVSDFVDTTRLAQTQIAQIMSARRWKIGSQTDTPPCSETSYGFKFENGRFYWTFINEEGGWIEQRVLGFGDGYLTTTALTMGGSPPQTGTYMLEGQEPASIRWTRSDGSSQIYAAC